MKILGLNFVMSVQDKGVNQFLDKASNSVNKVKDGLDDVGKKKPEKGSILSAIGEIAKLGLLKGMNDKLGQMQDLQRGIVGKGLSEGWKDTEQIVAKLGLQMGDVGKATKIVDTSLRAVVDTSRVTEDTARQLVGTFMENNINLEQSQGLLIKAGQLTKSFKLGADEVAQSFAFGTKTLGFSDKALGDITDQVVLLQSKTNLEGIVGNLPHVLNSVQKQIEQGIITKGQAADQVKRVNNLITEFRNTGVEIGKAQGLVDSLMDTSAGVSKAFSSILTGESGDELMQIANQFGKMGFNIGDVVSKLKTGNIDQAFSLIIEASAKARKLGGQNLQAFNTLIEKAMPGALEVMAAAGTKSFGAVRGTIETVNNAMANGTASKMAQSNMKALTNTVKDQEEYLKGLEERFNRVVSNAISPTIKAYGEMKISIMNDLSDSEKVQDSWILSGIMGLKKFQQAGLLPLMNSLSSFLGLSDESRKTLGRLGAGFETLGPMVKDSMDDVFFLTGTLVNLGKLGIVGKLKSMGAAFIAFGSSIFKVSNITKAYTFVTQALGVAWRFALGPVGLALIALTALGTGLVFAYKHSEKFRAVVDGSVQVLKNFWTALTNITFDDIIEGLKTAGKFFVRWMTPFGLLARSVEGLRSLFPEVFGNIDKFIQPAINLFDKFASSVGAVYDKVKNFTSGAVGTMFSKVTGMFNKTVTPAAIAPTVKSTTAGVVTNKPEPRKPITIDASVFRNVTHQEGEAPKFFGDAAPTETAEPFRVGSSANEAEMPVTPPPTPIAQIEKGRKESDKMKNGDLKQLATVMIAVGQEVIRALSNNQNINVELVGDAKRFMKIGKISQSNRMVTEGITR